MKPKIAAYITCYQDQKSANQCIQAIESQSTKVASIYIVDNSHEELSLNNSCGTLLIHHHPSNIGIAEGLAHALEWAIRNEYHFLWAFDQDSIPKSDCLEILLEQYNQLSNVNNYDVGIIAPTPVDPKTHEFITGAIFLKDRFVGIKHDSNVDFYECDAPITSGSLIPLKVAKCVDLPRIELFIDGVDFDYGLRIKKKGFYNIIVTKAIMYHSFGNPDKVKFMNDEIYIQQYSPLRYYYICRNHTYLDLYNSKEHYRFTSLVHRIRCMLVKIILIILYGKNDRLLKIWACLIGTYHGLIGKLGKTWQ